MITSTVMVQHFKVMLKNFNIYVYLVKNVFPKDNKNNNTTTLCT